jgi:hypothetical protein
MIFWLLIGMFTNGDYQNIQGITVLRVNVYFVLLLYAENFLPGNCIKLMKCWLGVRSVHKLAL